MNPKTKLLLLFLLDCVVFSNFYGTVCFTSLKTSPGPRTFALLLFSVYGLTRYYTRNRLSPLIEKAALVETAKALMAFVGFALLLTICSILKDSLDVLLKSFLFLSLLWLLGVLVFFWRFAGDLTKLKISSAV